MVSPQTNRRRERRPPKPLDAARLADLATHYVARYATSAAKLERYLARKLRERGWEDEGEADVPELVAQHVAAGHVDDDAYARMRAGGLVARGYGARRVAQVLYADGLEEDVRSAHAPDEGTQRAAALRYARRRRLGPFATAKRGGDAMADRALRQKQLAAMVRAGHSFDHAAQVIDARQEAELERWVEEYECED